MAALVILDRLTGRLPPAAAVRRVSARDYEVLVAAVRELASGASAPP